MTDSKAFGEPLEEIFRVSIGLVTHLPMLDSAYCGRNTASDPCYTLGCDEPVNEWIRHSDAKAGVTLVFIGVLGTMLFNLVREFT